MNHPGFDSEDLPPQRPGAPASPELVQRRAMIAAGVAQAAWRNGAGWVEDDLGGVRVLRFAPPGRPAAAMLHLHGGGFRLGAPEMVGAFATALAASCGIEIVVPAYRLAPEHPFPAGLSDARSVLAALHGQGAGRIILSGDSAGGGLAASLTALAPSLGVRPVGLILLSPWLDLTVTSGSYRDHAEADKLFSKTSAQEAAELYLQGLSPRHPLASPLYGPLAAFPETLINVSEHEVLLDDGRRFADALRTAGVKVTLLSTPDMEHVAVTRDLRLHGAAEAFAAIEDFVRRRLATAPA
jgi:acetyl esterase/lipase